MTLENNIFFGFCWCPKAKESHVRNTLQRSSSPSKGFFSSGQLEKVPFDSSQTPPTSFDLDDFTTPFQVFFF